MSSMTRTIQRAALRRRGHRTSRRPRRDHEARRWMFLHTFRRLRDRVLGR